MDSTCKFTVVCRIIGIMCSHVYYFQQASIKVQVSQQCLISYDIKQDWSSEYFSKTLNIQVHETFKLTCL